MPKMFIKAFIEAFLNILEQDSAIVAKGTAYGTIALNW
jgi:hypothetical protein